MHLTDEQLNEYLDNETTERTVIEMHLSSCDNCAARLSALQALFVEIESLPELELTHSLAARFTSTPNLIPQLPRWLTLIAILQAVLALIVIVWVAPFIAQWFSPYSEVYTMPSLANVLLDLQLSFTAWEQSLQAISLPELPSNILTLPVGFTPELLSISVIGMFLVWVFSNWWLLHKKNNSLA